MKLKNRFIRMATALAIVGVVAAQIPSRPSVSMAADGYPEGDRGLLNLQGAGAVVAGTVVAGAVYGAITNAGAGSVGGGSIVGAVGGGRKPIYNVTQDNAGEFSDIRSIIDTANLANDYKDKEYTVFWPTNAALTKAIGAQQIQLTAGNTELARAFLSKLTVAGKFNISNLKKKADSGGQLKTLSGDNITLSVEGDTVMANGVKVLAEMPASNGWVLELDGLISTDFE